MTPYISPKVKALQLVSEGFIASSEDVKIEFDNTPTYTPDTQGLTSNEEWED